MSEQNFEFELNEDELALNRISDEALEIAGGTAKQTVNYTLGACTGLSVCPA
jgi:hypothetical protein